MCTIANISAQPYYEAEMRAREQYARENKALFNRTVKPSKGEAAKALGAST